MLALDRILIPPSVNHISLSTYIIFLSLLINLPFLSLFLGGALYSLVFNLIGSADGNPLYVRFSERILETFVFRKSLGLIFGVAPMVVLYSSFAQLLYHSGLPVSNFFLPLIVITVVGFALTYGYQLSFRFRSSQFLTHIALGLVGAAFLMVATLILTSIISQSIHFESRTFVRSFPGLVLSWGAVARHLLFLALTIGMTGAGLLLFFSDLFDSGGNLDSELLAFIRRVGASSCLLAVVLTPPVAFCVLFTLPQVAISWKVVASTLVALATLLVAFFSLQRARAQASSWGASAVFLIFFVSYSFSTTGDLLSLSNATKEHRTYLVEEALKEKLKVAKTEEKEAHAKEEDVEKVGEMIFTTRCSACHQFGARVVGPPLLTVLPKYKDSEDQLAAFIQNPAKKNPDYPPMPSLGLTADQAEAVARYVLKRMDTEEKM